MPLALIPRDLPEPLTDRLRRLGRRLRLQTTFRAGGRMVVVGLVALLAIAFLDWRFHLPALVRALLLTGTLTAALLYYVRAIRRPLRGSHDPLRLALRLEARYPGLNDALASAVQFLRLPDDDGRSSPGLRQEVIRHAIVRAGEYDWDDAVDRRGARRWSLGALAVACVAAGLLLTFPRELSTAARRLAFPYAGIDWPTQTQIAILRPQPVPARIPRGEAFELHVGLSGVVPDRAVLAVWVDGAAGFEQAYSVPRDEAHPDAAELALRLEGTRLPRDFRFQVRANDAATPIYSVAVRPAPRLVPIDGRPSPQTRLDFPAYTGLRPVELPDGTSVTEGVAGTRVTVRAATDRPVARAWVAYRPEQARLPLAAALAPLASPGGLGPACAWALGREGWADQPVEIRAGGTELHVSFVPRLPGAYALCFEDESGLGGARLFDCRVFSDPAPSVRLDRPSGGKDPLMLVPEANFVVEAEATDKIYAVRSLALEYRTNREDRPRALSLGDVDTLSRLLPPIGGLMGGALSVAPVAQVHIRPPDWSAARRCSVAEFRHTDGRELQEGDVLFLQAAATDFDDVTGNKAPGRSQEVELLIVSRARLESALQQGQASIRGELLKLHGLQLDARAKVTDAIDRLRRSERLSPQDQDRLLNAEQSQQQLRNRVNAPEDGLRAELGRLERAVEVNRLPPSATTERIREIARELGRLAAEELDAVEPFIGEGRREQEQVGGSKAAGAALAQAERHQKEIERTLSALLERLEPWSSAGELRGEARAVQAELRRLAEESRRLAGAVPAGEKRERLRPEQRDELDRAAARHERLAERGRQLAEKVDRLADERERTARERAEAAGQKEAAAAAAEAKTAHSIDAEARRAAIRQAEALRAEAEQSRESADALRREADTLRKATQSGQPDAVKERLREVGPSLRANEVGRALEQQQAAANALEKLVESLEEKPAGDGERLAKKAARAAAALEGLLEEQERLQKKVRAAGEGDPLKRADQLQKLAAEQERLQQQARELAQQLTRARADDPAQGLREAAQKMEEARRQLEQGEAPEQAQDEALDRLDDARAQLDRTSKDQNEELLREKLGKVADQVRALRDRQRRAVEEAERVHAEVRKAGKWSRPVLASLGSLRDQQRGLGEETRTFADTQFAGQRVFARMLRQAADAMEAAAGQLDNRREDVLDQLEDRTGYQADLEDRAQAGIVGRQRRALRRLDQVVDALKPDPDAARAQAVRPAPDGQPAGGGMPPPPGDGSPPLAQLKALRALQAELLERTAAFDKRHPDRSDLDDDAAAELEELGRAQKEIAELFQELSAGPEGEPP